MREQVDKIARIYKKVSLWLIVALTLVGLLFIQISGHAELISSLLFSAVYSLVVSLIFGICWRSVALHSPAVLSRFYLAATVLRMLLALIVVLLGAVLLRDSRQVLLGFTLIFVCFYLALLVHECIYFARVEKKHLLK